MKNVKKFVLCQVISLAAFSFLVINMAAGLKKIEFSSVLMELPIVFLGGVLLYGLVMGGTWFWRWVGKPSKGDVVVPGRQLTPPSTQGKRCILFEGVALPESALSLDHLGLYGNLPELSEDASLWLWRFTICGGMYRTCDSATVLRHAEETLRLVTRFQDRLLASVPAHYRDFKPEILEEWRQVLEVIIEIAGERATCSWISPLLPEDENFGRDPAEVMSETLAKLDAAAKRAQKAGR